MSQLPSKTEHGYEQPSALQFSVFLANRVGQLKDLLELFAERSIRVLGLSVVDSADWAVIRLVFSDPKQARSILEANGLPFTTSEILLAELADARAMIEIFGHLLQAEINVHFAYLLAVRRADLPLVALHVDDYVMARQVLLKHGLTLYGDDELADAI